MGPACPACDNTLRLAVISTRPHNGGTMRRRRCLDCGERFTTHEHLEGTDHGAGLARVLEHRLSNVIRATRGDFDTPEA